MVKKLYLFRLLSQLNHNDPSSLSNFQDGIFLSESWPLLGLDRGLWKNHHIKNQNKFVLKPFEVRQKKFEHFLLSLDNFGIDLIRINFTEELYDDEHEELIDLIRKKDTQGLLDFIADQRDEFGKDIEEITFKAKNKGIHESITFSRNAVLTAPVEGEKLEELISSKPIGLLSGTYMPLFEEKNGEM